MIPIHVKHTEKKIEIHKNITYTDFFIIRLIYFFNNSCLYLSHFFVMALFAIIKETFQTALQTGFFIIEMRKLIK
jgi:hypothetical protein